MATYVVTGCASGMGLAAVQRLESAGHTVIGVDLQRAQVIADLAVPDDRARAIAEVLQACAGRLDGGVLAAGIGPTPGRLWQIAEVNFAAAVDLLTAWRPALAAAECGKVVVLGSNSATCTPAVPHRTVRALLDRDTGKAVRSLRWRAGGGPAMMYAASKIALSRWVRRHAVRPDWAGAGIRLNMLAPGAIMTPLLQRQLDSPRQGAVVRAFPVPVGGFGDAGDLADWICFMLSDAADFLCGSVIFVDGGTDAYFRGDDWPRSLPAHAVPAYLWRFLGFARRRRTA